MMNANSMVQWTKHNRNRNLPSLPWFSEISGAVHLVLPGLAAGRQADEIQVNFKILKIHCTSKQLTFHCV